MKCVIRNNVVVLLTAAVLFLCATSCTKRPRSVLSERQMREVLIDLHRADGTLQTVGSIIDNNKQVSAYYKSILDKHGITQAQFDSSLVWYTDNPNIFDKIYPSVIDALDREYNRAAIESQDAKERAKMRAQAIHRLDSIMQIPLQPRKQIEFCNPDDYLPHVTPPYIE